MPVSPRDFALWAAATGNKYPQTAEEKMSAAPHAYDFVKNLGKTSSNAPGSRVGGRIIYNQPISAQFADDNSGFHSPVTPDNNVPKVAGTLNNTMTGEHYDNQLRDTQEDNARSNNLVRNLGRAALATGVLAGGAILATRPEARQAVRSAIDTAQHQASNIGNRISDFLGGLGVSRPVDNEIIHNTGDVTPPTTGQRYQQERIPNAVQEMQVAKGANVGTPEKTTVPTTTASTSVKPVTESKIISTSQTFSPREEDEYVPNIPNPYDLYGPGFKYAFGYAPKEIIEARRAINKGEPNPLAGKPLVNSFTGEIRNPLLSVPGYAEAFPEKIGPSTSQYNKPYQAATEQLLRAAESIRSREPYQMEIPGVGATLMALRSKETGVTPEDVRVYQPPAPSKIGPSTTQYSLLHTTPDPWTGEYTPAVSTSSQQTSDLNPTVGGISRIAGGTKFAHSPEWLKQHQSRGSGGFEFFPGEEGKYVSSVRESPILTTRTGTGEFVHHAEAPAPKLGGKSFVRIAGEGAPKETVTVEQPIYPGELGPAEQRDVTGAFVTPKVTRLAGARDIEAAIATHGAQGVYPEGPYSSSVSGEEYAPASEIWRQSSTIDPRIVTAGEQSVLGKIQGYLGGKTGWAEQAKQQREIARQERLAQTAPKVAAFQSEIEEKPYENSAIELSPEIKPSNLDPDKKQKALTFLKQALNLYQITEDPEIMDAAVKGALPLNVSLPGGETVPTKTFFKPFGVVGAGKPSAERFMETNPTQVQALENIVIGKQTTLNNVKAGILKQFGKGPTDKITSNMFNALPQSQRKVLLDAHNAVVEETTRLNQAKDMPILYSIPEEIQQGTKMAPIVSQTTGDVVGMSAVPAERSISTSELYRMRASGGAGRQEVGGVGRRREALETEHGHVRSGSPVHLETVLYRNKDTGEILTADDVGLAEIAYGTVTPISGETVEPQRILGKEGRTYKGISADVINRASFDPAERQRILEAFPQAATPEGLIYSPSALESPGGGLKAYKTPSFFVNKANEAGLSVHDFANEVLSNPSQHTKGTLKIAAETKASFKPTPAPGSARAQKIASLVASAEALKATGAGAAAAPTEYRTRLENLTRRTPTPAEQSTWRSRVHAGIWGDPNDLQTSSAAQTIALEPATTVIHHAFQPTQLTLPGAGIAPQIRSTPALEEAVATEKYMGTRPGQNLRAAMQKALSKAATYQPALF